MVRRLTLLGGAVALVAGLAGAAPAQAGACDSDGYPATGVTEIETAAATYYVDDRGAVLGNGVWIYEESNGVPGLQRGGTSSAPGPLAETDDCSTPNPDTLVL